MRYVVRKKTNRSITAINEITMGYNKLDIYKISFDLFIKTHRASFLLPKYELYELGSQLRRSADSIVSNIVEGYGRNRYKADYIKFLVTSHASNNETICHLQKIIILYPDISKKFELLQAEYDVLGAKINKYIQYVEKNWNSLPPLNS